MMSFLSGSFHLNLSKLLSLVIEVGQLCVFGHHCGSASPLTCLHCCSIMYAPLQRRQKGTALALASLAGKSQRAAVRTHTRTKATLLPERSGHF